MKFLIWSTRERAWWLPNEAGYTPKRAEAGRYTLEDAKAICDSMNYTDVPMATLVAEDVK